ncbi:farnesyl-diphosphate synthase [Clostridium cavendishii DSM 21758]|uniref:Farnesyl diphosphate synthase n=1 Tax=Clostridium cavendishii DSM 21758 TaxID=1121302 RepID=A0A1M6KJQ3_9CLOT|nr:farnesyl diphosphate synthase [Clostridium cavendishii]SHJ59176.1 farnesyl-diphosphate synthase [Clostridium cavendishii DSM 21758]
MKSELLKEKIDNYLNNYFKDKYDDKYEKVLFDSMSYSLNIGGKRIRPILMLLTYGIYKEDLDKIIKFAAAIEMIHTYSLIHDDLPCMDNDDLRRGKPTNHKVFGETMAVLAGDALLNEAMNILFDASLEYGNLGLKASKEISNAASAYGMIAGQVVDILNEQKKSIDIKELEYMHTKKTGELIKASVVSGAILGDASEEDIKALEEFGYKLGLAFQVKDDILDVIGTTEKLGKKVNSDTEGNKNNYITLFGLEKSIAISEQLTKECLEILNNITGNTKDLENLTLNLLRRQN